MMDNIIIALFLGFVVLLIVLDIAMVVSLVKSGDERRSGKRAHLPSSAPSA